MRPAGGRGTPWFAGRVVSLAILGLLAGCSDRRTATLVPVTGSVQRQGTPLAGSTVVFIPEPPHQAPLAFGAVGSDGRYELLSANRYRGVLPGNYIVCVTAASESPEQSPNQAADPLLPRPKATPPTGVYADPKTTPLRFEVPATGGTFDIDLEAANTAPKPPSTTASPRTTTSSRATRPDRWNPWAATKMSPRDPGPSCRSGGG